MSDRTSPELPIHRLNAGTMTDREAVEIAAATVRMSYRGTGPSETLDRLASRLEQVGLANPGAVPMKPARHLDAIRTEPQESER